MQAVRSIAIGVGAVNQIRGGLGHRFVVHLFIVRTCLSQTVSRGGEFFALQLANVWCMRPIWFRFVNRSRVQELGVTTTTVDN